MYKVGIAGATGYTGNELLQLIHRHPQLEVGWITSESSAGSSYSKIHAVPWDYPLITLAEGWSVVMRWMWSFCVCHTRRRSSR